MTARFDQPQPTRRLEMVLAFAFGCIAIGVVLWLAFRGQSLSEQQFEICASYWRSPAAASAR
jgi:hypothetical protein